MWLRTVARLIPSFCAISLFWRPFGQPAQDLPLALGEGWRLGEHDAFPGGGPARLAWLRAAPVGRARAQPLERPRQPPRAVDRLQDVDERGAVGPRARDPQHRDVQGLLLLRRARDRDLEPAHRLALARHRQHRAVLVAEAVAEDVAPAEHVVAAPAQRLARHAAEQTLRGGVPVHEVAGHVRGDRRCVALGQDVQDLGAGVRRPVVAVLEHFHDLSPFNRCGSIEQSTYRSEAPACCTSRAGPAGAKMPVRPRASSASRPARRRADLRKTSVACGRSAQFLPAAPSAGGAD